MQYVFEFFIFLLYFLYKIKSVVIFMERKRGLPVKTVHIRAYGGGPAVAGG